MLRSCQSALEEIPPHLEQQPQSGLLSGVGEWIEKVAFFICALWVRPIKSINYIWFDIFFLNNFRANILCNCQISLTTVPFLCPGREDLQFLGNIDWFPPLRHGANFQLCVRPLLSGVCVFLTAALKKTDSIELYKAYNLYLRALGLLSIKHCATYLKYFSSLFHGRENSMNFWSFWFLLLKCR